MPGVLETQRLALRELLPSDLDFVAAMLGDPETMRFYPRPYTREQSAEWIDRQRRRYASDGHGLWLVTLRSTGEPVGQVGLTRQHVDGVAEDEVGYLIARRFWRQGYAAEAALATRDHAFGALLRPRVISLIRPENLPSQAVARRLGMSVEKSTCCFEREHLVYVARRP
jgi:RimJ/RimL family protein N-acetyltransferase